MLCADYENLLVPLKPMEDLNNGHPSPLEPQFLRLRSPLPFDCAQGQDDKLVVGQFPSAAKAAFVWPAFMDGLKPGAPHLCGEPGGRTESLTLDKI